MTDAQTEAAVQALSERTGHVFKDPALLKRALTHRSKLNESHETEHNERLEFLGDAVIQLTVSHLLYAHFGSASEGELSKLRATLVSKGSLANKARRLDVGHVLRMGEGEERSGGKRKESLLADAYEAIVAAIYLDGGFQPACRFIETQFGPDLTDVQQQSDDPKTDLQQHCQRVFRSLPAYRLSAEQGPEHDRTFFAEVLIGARVLGAGQGKSKKLAEQAAARAALLALRAE
jgi:ribonuclease-3